MAERKFGKFEAAVGLDKEYQGLTTGRDIKRSARSPSKSYAGLMRMATPAESRRAMVAKQKAKGKKKKKRSYKR